MRTHADKSRPDGIVEQARQLGVSTIPVSDVLDELAALRAERDALREELARNGAYAAGRKAGMDEAAKICEGYAKRHSAQHDDDGRYAQSWMMLQCSAAIRAARDGKK